MIRSVHGRIGALLCASGTSILLVAACGDTGTGAPVNRPPLPVGSIPADTVAVGDSVTLAVAAHFADPDGDPLAFTAASSDTAVAAARASGDSVTVTALSTGTAGITVTATDPEGLGAAQTFRITVPNQPPLPVGSIPADTVAVGDSVTLAVAAHFADPDGDSLALTAASSDTAVAAVRASGDSVTVTALAKGAAGITVTATDPEGLGAAQAFRITVPNQPPRPVGSIPDSDLADGALTLDASSYFTDPDGDPLLFTAESSSPRVAAASAAEATVTVVPVARGSATITMRAHDPEGPGGTQVFGVTVPNQPPVRVGTIPDRELTAGTFTVDVAAYFRDPEGEALYYTARTGNSRVATASTSGAVVTVRSVARGTTTISATARDPHGLETTQAFTVRVPNSAPTAVGRIPDIVVTEGTDSELALLPFFADPDGDALDFDARSSDPGIVSTGIDGSNLQMKGEKVGSVTLTVTARDSGGLEAAHAFGVRVEEPPDGFDLQLAFSDSVPSSHRPAIRAAAAEWMAILADTELPDVPVNSRLSCGGLTTVETIASLDDLLIMVHARGDEPRGVVAWASLCAVRSNPFLPYLGVMVFDSEDLDLMSSRGDLGEIAFHEIAHVLGFGTVWGRHGLTAGGSADPHFTGRRAVAAFDAAGGAGYTGGKVPTEGAHWRASVFGTEMMVSSNRLGRPDPVSAITLQSMADMGYAVDASRADSYQLAAPAPAPVPGDGVAPVIYLGDDVRWGPVDVVDGTGRVVRTIEPEFGNAGGMREWMGTIPVRVSGGR